MFAWLAALAFLVALIFHLAAGNVAKYVTDAELIGFILLALAVALPLVPWKRQP